MIRDFVQRRRRLVLCVLAAGIVVVALATLVLVFRGRGDVAETACVQAARQEYPGSVIEVQSVSRQGFSSFIVDGSASEGGAVSAEFSCLADGRGGWVGFAGGTDPAP